jgi:hypothetical protein
MGAADGRLDETCAVGVSAGHEEQPLMAGVQMAMFHRRTRGLLALLRMAGDRVAHHGTELGF